MTYRTEDRHICETDKIAVIASMYGRTGSSTGRDAPTKPSTSRSKWYERWQPKATRSSVQSSLVSVRSNTTDELSAVLQKRRALTSEFKNVFREIAPPTDVGPFEPSKQTIELLGDLVSIAAADAAKFANELDRSDNAYGSEPQRLRRSLVRAVHNSLSLFARVSGEVGNGNADISASTGFRPVYADYLLAELPVIPKADAGRILLSIRRDLDKLCYSRNIKAGRAILSKQGGELVVSLNAKVPARSASLFDPVNSVSFE